MSKNAVIALACQIVKLREAARMWKQTAQAHKDQRDIQAANHEAKMVEHRTAFGVRTDADAKIIVGLREELVRVRNSLGIQAAKEASKVLGMVDGEGLRGAAERVVKERDGLRAEVAALQERLRASIARGDLAQMEVAALKSQSPKQHPVRVGEWVRRTSGGDTGRMAQVKSIAVLQYDVQIDGYKAFWASSNCEPCDPPTEATHATPEGKKAAEAVIRDDRKTEPKPGDTVRLVRVPTQEEWLHEDKHCKWNESFGKPGDTATVLKDDDNKCPLCIGVELSNTDLVDWPMSCVEVVRTDRRRFAVI